MTWRWTYPRAVIHDMHVTDPGHRPSWTHGKPILTVNHFTVSCGVEWPATGRFGSEGIGPAFGIRRDGTVAQYVDLDRSTWHARDCSHYGVGIEYDANPPSCPITLAQLEAGAELNAWLCKAFKFPANRSVGIDYDTGIKVHTDGLQDGGTKWDEARHWDAIWKATDDPIDAWVSPAQRIALNSSPWTSRQFLAAVDAYLNPPPDPPGGDEDLTPAQAQQLANVNAVIIQTAKHLNVPDAGVAGKPWPDALAQKLADMVAKIEALP